MNVARHQILGDPSAQVIFSSIFTVNIGCSTVLRSLRLYSALQGITANIYKTFIVRSWDLLSSDGVCGLIHEEGVFDDPGSFRRLCYERLYAHYQFRNEL